MLAWIVPVLKGPHFLRLSPECFVVPMGVEHPNAIILIVTADRAIQLQREVRKTGINGFCPKDKVSCLLTAIRALARGQTYFHFREPAQATA
jgi:DNA-binding NarL/FixJ family response regulator